MRYLIAKLIPPLDLKIPAHVLFAYMHQTLRLIKCMACIDFVIYLFCSKKLNKMMIKLL